MFHFLGYLLIFLGCVGYILLNVTTVMSYELGTK